MKFFSFLLIIFLLFSSNSWASLHCDFQISPDCKNWTRTELSLNSQDWSYFSYVPTQREEPFPLLVMLHGCNQDGVSFAKSTQMNFLAEQNGFSVLYPNQRKGANILNCWNWFESRNQKVQGSEAEAIVEMIYHFQSQKDIDSDQIYVAGFSSGSATTSILLSCYKDFFAGGAVNAGLIYRAASNLFEAQRAMRFGSVISVKEALKQAEYCGKDSRRSVRTLLIHGDKDSVVAPLHLEELTEYFLGLSDLRDDGFLNRSISYEPFHQERVSFSSYPYIITDYDSQSGLRSVYISDLDHEWSGGLHGEPYTNAEGPSVSEMIIKYLGL